MRVVLAAPLYPPEIGGPATYAKLLCEGLPAKGIEVELVKFSEVRHLPKIIRHYAYYRRVLDAARRADAVLALDPVSTGLPAMKAARRAGKPFVVKIVGDYAWEQGQQRLGISEDLDTFVRNTNAPLAVRILQRIQTRVARSAARIIVPSEYLKGIVAAWGIPHNKIDVVYNAAPLGSIGAVPTSVERMPRPLVLSAGRLVPWKGMTGVIDAAAALREGTIHASLAIVGDGPDRASLVAYAEQKLKKDYIFTGALSHADTLAVMKSADVLVLNSSYEGLSHLLIEALMLGVPTIATRAGGNPEMITGERDGILIPVGDAKALSDAVSRLLPDLPLRRRFAVQAIESSKRFSVDAMVQRTAEILTNVEPSTP